MRNTLIKVAVATALGLTSVSASAITLSFTSNDQTDNAAFPSSDPLNNASFGSLLGSANPDMRVMNGKSVV